MNKTLSNHDISDIVGYDIPVYPYDALRGTRFIHELFTRGNAVLLLYPTYSRTNGHWTCLIRHTLRKRIEFFDPYGFKPDDISRHIPDNLWLTARLSKLLYDVARTGWLVEYNEVPLQSTADGVNTCGRWCAVRIYYRNYSLEDFQNMFKNKKNLDQEIVNISNFLRNKNI